MDDLIDQIITPEVKIAYMLAIALPIVLLIAILALLALIPAKIAQKKGYSFWGYYAFGFFFFLIALIVSLAVTDKVNPKQVVVVGGNLQIQSNPPAFIADELLKLKTLLDSGAISQADYEAMRHNLMGR